MKKDFHPVSKKTKVKCACGFSGEIVSTLGKDLEVEICAHCHPFFTGKQKVTRAGRVNKFMKKWKES